jgi:rubrerythrin
MFLEGDMVEITAAYPAGIIGTTAENLAEAADGENLEWKTPYLGFADVADLEGFPEIAKVWREIARTEVGRETRYRKLLANVKEGKIFKRDGSVKWRCRNCGYISEGAEPHVKFPACDHEQAY